MKHAYDHNCSCPRCLKEAARREAQSTQARLLDWAVSRNPRRRRVACEYWDAIDSGRPMSSDDY